jgi:hypothetical protein
MKYLLFRYRKQMKQFSIHKVNKPVMRPRGAEGDEEMSDANKYYSGMDGVGDIDAGETNAGAMSGSMRAANDASLLTAEEQEALQPKEIKVVNPWIHEATHKEYLESVKVSTYIWPSSRSWRPI